MNLKINIQARLKRHARNASLIKKRKNLLGILKKFKFISFLIVLILPIYPSFWAIWVDKEYAVGNYDESTIIESYEWDALSDNTTIFSQDSWFIKSNIAINDNRDVAWIKWFIYYTIQDWDSLWSISKKFDINIDSILWSNNFPQDKVLRPWDTIKIPPVSWIIYTVESNDNIDSIASKFKVDKLYILAQNQIEASEELKIGQQLVVPWAKKPEPPKQIIIEKTIPKEDKLLTKNNKLLKENKNSKNSKLALNKVKNTTLKSWYTVKYTWGGRWFAYWNCTYYVANHKNVTWRWNANQWLNNARAAWVATWSEPASGAIISFRWSWYNPYYGHVGIVSEVWDDYIIVKDMNYRRFNEVTVRKIPKNDASIKWYIYSN